MSKISRIVRKSLGLRRLRMFLRTRLVTAFSCVGTGALSALLILWRALPYSSGALSTLLILWRARLMLRRLMPLLTLPRL